MKKNNLVIALPAIALAVMMTGCGLFNKNSTKINPTLPQDRENIVQRKIRKRILPMR